MVRTEPHSRRSPFALLALLALSVIPALAQQPCTFRNKAPIVTTGADAPFHNNTTNAQCNAFVLTWWSSGFSALSIQLQGSDDNVTYTAFSGATTVVGGTTNPSTALSGSIIIQAQSKLAHLEVKLNSKGQHHPGHKLPRLSAGAFPYRPRTDSNLRWRNLCDPDGRRQRSAGRDDHNPGRPGGGPIEHLDPAIR